MNDFKPLARESIKELTLDEALKAPRDIGFDFETEGLDWINDKAITLGLANREFAGYIDVGKYPKETFGSFLNDFFLTHRPIGQNIKFDFHVSEQFTPVPVSVEFADSMLISQIIDENASHGLDNMTSVWLGDDYLINKRFVDSYKKEHKLKSYKQIPFNILAARGVEDAYNTVGMYEILKPKLEEKKVYALEKQVTMALLRIERNGTQMDKEHLLRCKDELEKRIKEFNDKHPDLNMNSPKQVADFLYVKNGIKCPKYNPTGSPKTDAETLALIDHPIAQEVVEYHHCTHTLSTYIQGFLDRLDTNNRMHCNFKQMGARTGRMSCVNPNLQQLPKKGWIAVMVKGAFIGWITTFDYSQEEAKLYAYINHDKKMIEAVEADRDLYRYLAATMFGVPFEEVTKEQRETGKVIFLGKIYGMGDRKFRAKSGGLDPESSKEFFENLKKMQTKVNDDVQLKGYVETVIGRRRHLDLDEAYKGLNSIIQGSAADIMKKVIVNLPTDLLDRVISQVHDELVLHSLEENDIKRVGEIMCDFKPFHLTYEYGNGKNWYEAWLDKENGHH